MHIVWTSSKHIQRVTQNYCPLVNNGTNRKIYSGILSIIFSLINVSKRGEMKGGGGGGTNLKFTYSPGPLNSPD